MAESRLIGAYLAELSAQLPTPIVAELADGLDQTHRHYLGQGLGPDSAAAAAVAEFGEPQVIVAAFTRSNPARRAARRLLAAGPVVGACWDTALIINRAWALAGARRGTAPAGPSAHHGHRAARHRRLQQALPSGRARSGRGVHQHGHDRRCPAQRHHLRRPTSDLAGHRGHGSQRGPHHLHRPPLALGSPGRLTAGSWVPEGRFGCLDDGGLRAGAGFICAGDGDAGEPDRQQQVTVLHLGEGDAAADRRSASASCSSRTYPDIAVGSLYGSGGFRPSSQQMTDVVDGSDVQRTAVRARSLTGVSVCAAQAWMVAARLRALP